MAKGNLGLFVREEFAEGNVLVGLKTMDIEKRMIQGNHMVMVKRCVEDFWLVWRNMVEFHKEVLQGSLDLEILFETGNVRDCHPFITLILGPKISGREGGVCQQSVAASCTTIVMVKTIQKESRILLPSVISFRGGGFWAIYFSCFTTSEWISDQDGGFFFRRADNLLVWLIMAILDFHAKKVNRGSRNHTSLVRDHDPIRKNGKIKHASLSTSVEKPNGCDRFMIFRRDNLDFDRRYGYGTIMNENGGRKPFGMGLPFSEKAKLFGVPFPRWKWESGFPEVRLFLGSWTLLEWFSPIPWWRKKLQQLSEIYNLERMPAPEAQLFTSVFIIHRPYFQHPDTHLFWTQDQVYEWFTAPHIAVIKNDIQDVLHNYICQLNHQPPPLKDISHTSLGPQHDLLMIPTPSAISKPKSTGIIIKEERPNYTDFLYQDSQDPWEDFLPLSQHLHQFPQPTMDEPGPSDPGPSTQPSTMGWGRTIQLFLFTQFVKTS
ncbi:hypothetical protein WN943_026925 [Citrus x changshan-huyou]